MAKESEKPEQQAISLSADQLKELLASVQAQSFESIKQYIDESRKPSAADIAKKESAKQHWQAVIAEGESHKKWVQSNCTHIHPDENKSLIWRFPVCFPRDAWILICCRCQKKWANYEDSKIVQNAEFDHWWRFPSLTIRGM